MHSGFIGMRGLLPMNMRREVKLRELTPEASADVARLEQAFGQARREFGQAGAFLFGDFSAADAMFAPVVNRLHVYKVAVTPGTRAYMDAMMAGKTGARKPKRKPGSSTNMKSPETACAGDSGSHMRLGVAGGSRHAATRACRANGTI
jgi:glutathione S-transferase